MRLSSFFRGVALAALLVGAAMPVAHAKGRGAEQPSPSSNPVLAQALKNGTKVYYMGPVAGLEGWFLVKGEEVQIAYVAPDKNSVIIGAVFDQDGQNLTALQVHRLFQSNAEVADLLKKASEETVPVAGVGASNPVVDPAKIPQPVASLSAGERLMEELKGTAGVALGKPDAPEIYMIMDTDCPHCQMTWQMLRGAVAEGRVRIRFVPIGISPETEKKAAVLIGLPNALEAWDKYVGGDKSQLAGTPDPKIVKAVHQNHAFID